MGPRVRFATRRDRWRRLYGKSLGGCYISASARPELSFALFTGELPRRVPQVRWVVCLDKCHIKHTRVMSRSIPTLFCDFWLVVDVEVLVR